MTDKIIENNQIVDIDLVIPNNYNPKPDYNSTEELQLEFQKIKDSVEYHGQMDPLIVREVNGKYELINGYHRWQAMKDLGFTKVEIKNLGVISKNEAIKKTLSFEELKIDLDTVETAKLVKALKGDQDSLKGLPYFTDEIEDKLKMLDFNWKDYDGEGGLDDLGNKKKKVTCPNCGEEFEV